MLTDPYIQCGSAGVLLMCSYFRVSATPVATGNLEFEMPPGNTGNILKFN